MDAQKDTSDYWFYMSIILLFFLIFTQVSKRMEANNVKKMKKLKKLTKMTQQLTNPPLVAKPKQRDHDLEDLTKALEQLGPRAERQLSDAGEFRRGSFSQQ